MSTPVEIREVTKIFPGRPDQPPAVGGISLTIEPGSAVSVIGTNGAGKSTLLKLIAGVLAPTSGSIRRPNRCSSLLELGAGFHDDLTGRENLDLTVALALPGPGERRRRVSEALELSGLGDAVDLPVKHMSSGMVARLACAVAVAAQPDLLLVDEVLAVGDSAFQREMLSRVAELVDQGTSLLLVTHSLDLAAVATKDTVWLHEGEVRSSGPASEVLADYEATVRGWGRTFGERHVTLERVAVQPEHIEPGGSLRVEADLRCTADVGPVDVRLEVRPVVGEDTVWMRSHEESFEMRQLNLVAASNRFRIPALSPGRHRVEFTLDEVPISPTRVEVLLVLSDEHNLIIDELACELSVGRALLRPHYHLEAKVVSQAATTRSGSGVAPGDASAG